MPDAEAIATQLAYEFLRTGRYVQSSGPVSIPDIGVGAAGTGDEEVAEYAERVEAFSGLAVQSVGFEEGTDNPAVHIYLTRGGVKQVKALPAEIDDVPVRVHKMGLITVRPEAMSAASTNRGNIFEINDRVCCGSSCAPTSEQSAGTLGAIVKIGAGSGLFLLSNNHVFSGCNHVPHNQPILAPANMDGRPDAVAPHEIGRHHMLHELHSGDPHFVVPGGIDLALARVSDPGGISSWQGDAQDGYDTPTAFAAPVSLLPVKKTGRTTGLTFGEVEAHITTPTPIGYKAKHFRGTVWFRDIWTVRGSDGEPFVLPGDSGSLVVTEDGQSAVGVLFAGNPAGDYGWIIPMPAALAMFGGLTLVSNHGV